MEAGYDYTLLGSQPRRRVWAGPALFLAALALALLTAGGAYYGFAAQAQAADGMAAAQPAERDVTPPAALELSGTDYWERADRPGRLHRAAIAGQELYPGGRRSVESWVNPLGYEPEAAGSDTDFRWWAGAGSR